MCVCLSIWLCVCETIYEFNLNNSTLSHRNRIIIIINTTQNTLTKWIKCGKIEIDLCVWCVGDQLTSWSLLKPILNPFVSHASSLHFISKCHTLFVSLAPFFFSFYSKIEMFCHHSFIHLVIHSLSIHKSLVRIIHKVAHNANDYYTMDIIVTPLNLSLIHSHSHHHHQLVLNSCLWQYSFFHFTPLNRSQSVFKSFSRRIKLSGVLKLPLLSDDTAGSKLLGVNLLWFVLFFFCSHNSQISRKRLRLLFILLLLLLPLLFLSIENII